MSTDTTTAKQLPAIIDQQSEQLPSEAPELDAAENLPTIGGLTLKVRNAIDWMVFGALPRRDAAIKAGLTDHGMRQALNKPAVLRHYNNQLEVLRTSGRPRALQRIIELADKSASEKVGLDAAKYLDSQGKSDQAQVNVGVQVNVAPGYMVDVTGQTSEAQQIAQQAGSSANCLEANDDVLTDD